MKVVLVDLAVGIHATPQCYNIASEYDDSCENAILLGNWSISITLLRKWILFVSPYLIYTSYLCIAGPFHEVKRKRDKRKEVCGNAIVASFLVLEFDLRYNTFFSFLFFFKFQFLFIIF